MKRICGLIIVLTMVFSITSIAFASVDEHPMIARSNPIIYKQK